MFWNLEIDEAESKAVVLQLAVTIILRVEYLNFTITRGI